jgi:hypothetical protein
MHPTLSPRSSRPGRHYEIGLDVADAAPHIVRRAVQLIGSDGRPLSLLPEDGDELLSVNVCIVTRPEPDVC